MWCVKISFVPQIISKMLVSVLLLHLGALNSLHTGSFYKALRRSDYYKLLFVQILMYSIKHLLSSLKTRTVSLALVLYHSVCKVVNLLKCQSRFLNIILGQNGAIHLKCTTWGLEMSRLSILVFPKDSTGVKSRRQSTTPEDGPCSQWWESSV